MTCINCGAEDTGKLCSNCGQPLELKRISFSESGREFWDNIIGLDGKFLRTLKDATLRPGAVAREYIRGNRVRYFGPVGYYLFMIGAFLLLLSVIGMDFREYMAAMQESMPMQDQRNTEVNLQIQQFMADNMRIVAFFIVPFMAFASQKFVFRKQGLNFLEHTVPSFYILGHWYWFSMTEALFLKFSGKALDPGLQMLLSALYMGFGYTSFVLTQPKWKTFLKGFTVYFVGFVLLMITTVVLGIITVIVLAFFFPETFDAIRPSNQH